jgi:hypothetical protein
MSRPIFTNESDRDMFFMRFGKRPDLVQYGSAMDQATIHLGIWSDVSALRHDCAKIMALEVQKFAMAHDWLHKLARYDDLVTQILHSQTFHRAFDFARAPAREDLGRMLQGIGDSAGNRELQRAALHEVKDALAVPQVDLSKLHERLFYELSGSQRRRVDKL